MTRANPTQWRGTLGFLVVMAGADCLMASAATTPHAPNAARKTLVVPPAGATCPACHGPTGAGMIDGERPRIAGESAYYLEKQLRDFASGARESAIMGPIAKTLSEADRTQVAAYFASLPRPAALASKQPTGAQSARGHQLATEGSEARRAQACDNCHGPEGSGVPLSAPTLAGQLAPYLAAQLKSWQQGTRHNDSGKLMASVASQLDDTDIAAVTSYYASLGSPPPKGQ
jgi:cytochrome c553